ncbi:MAG: tyrosine recombinase XerC [bacterium]
MPTSNTVDLCGEFINYLGAVRHLSPHTCSAYQRDLKKTHHCLNHKDWSAITQHDARSMAAKLHRQGLNPRSIQRLLSCLRSFYRYLQQHHAFKHNPIDGLKAPRPAKKLPQTLAVDDLSQLLNFPIENHLDIRDKAIIELLYSSGLRLAELQGCDLEQLDLTEGLIRVLGKGQKVRIIPVGRKAIQALHNWVSERSSWKGSGDTALFLSQRGLRLSRRSIQTIIKKRAQQQGIWQNVYPHLMRHSFASHILESSNNLRGVQELLGHADISTTQVYTHLNFQHLAQEYDKAHPRARLKSEKDDKD